MNKLKFNELKTNLVNEYVIIKENNKYYILKCNNVIEVNYYDNYRKKILIDIDIIFEGYCFEKPNLNNESVYYTYLNNYQFTLYDGRYSEFMKDYENWDYIGEYKFKEIIKILKKDCDTSKLNFSIKL